MDPLTTYALGKAAKLAVEKWGPTLFDLLKKKSKESKACVEDTYESYLKALTSKYSICRTFFDRDNGRYIYDFYVPSSVESGGVLHSNISFEAHQSEGRLSVIVGQGGSGKSILMRHFLMDVARTSSRVPIFIELRNINSPQLSVCEVIASCLQECGLTFSPEQVEYALNSGVFAVLLDGFDEIDPTFRRQYEKDILRVAAKSQSTFIVSSRPDGIFTAWDGWRIVKIAPLTLDEACTLVSKATFNESAKSIFVAKLRESLYESHRDFLSNPLLLSIMLLTYDRDAEIPSKLSVFYSRAYDALFTQHDALKGDYRRSRRTRLDIIDFAKIFSTFSLLTYLSRQFRFGLSVAVNHVKASSELTSIEVDPEDFLADAKQAVCLLVEEGLDLSYTHRSFQEYFAAKAVAAMQGQNQVELVSKLVINLEQDSIVSLLYELSPDLINRHMVIPGLKKILGDSTSRGKMSVSLYNSIMKKIFHGLLVIEGPVGESGGRATSKANIGLLPNRSRPEESALIAFALNRWLPRPAIELDDLARFERSVLEVVGAGDAPGWRERDIGFSKRGVGPKVLAVLRDSVWFYSRARLEALAAQVGAVERELQEREDRLSLVVKGFGGFRSSANTR